MDRRPGEPLRSVLLLLSLLAPGGVPAWAQAGTSEVEGVVEDVAGNPLPGAKITFQSTTAPDVVYTVEAGKKGRYFIPNLLYYEPGEWRVSVEAEGYEPHKIRVESRKADRTLIAEFESRMRSGQPFEVRIAAFGKARIDFVLARPQPEAAPPAAAERAEQGEAAPVPSARADPMVQAVRRAEAGDFEGALPFLEQAVSAAPEDLGRHELYATVLYNLKRFADAERELRWILERDPGRAGMEMLLADVAAAQGRHAEAEERLRAVAERSPDDPEVWVRLAWLADQAGRTDQAIAAHEKVVSLDPLRVESWMSLGDLYAATGALDKSEQAYQKVVALDPENAYKTFFNLGVLIEGKPHPSPADEARAIKAFRRAVEIKPDYAKAHLHLAYALLRTGDLAGARKAFERYLELEPQAPEAAEVRGFVENLPR